MTIEKLKERRDAIAAIASSYKAASDRNPNDPRLSELTAVWTGNMLLADIQVEIREGASPLTCRDVLHIKNALSALARKERTS